MIRLVILTIIVPLVTECSTGSRPAAATAPLGATAVTPETAAPQTPMFVRWNVISDGNGRLVIDAIVERRASLKFPVSVRVEIPQGLSLVLGPSQFEVPADGRTGESAMRLEFTYAGARPSADLKLIGDAGNSGVGIHATDTYRFGRTLETKKPEPSGPNVKVGDKDLGPAIPLDPQK